MTSREWSRPFPTVLFHREIPLNNLNMAKKYVIGIDYGTDSVRSVVVDTSNGKFAGSSVFEYPRWKKGLFCDPSVNQFRQHPLDYIEGLEESVKGALTGLTPDILKNIAGITVDTLSLIHISEPTRRTPISYAV